MIDRWIPQKKLPEYTGMSRTWCQRLLKHTKGLIIKVVDRTSHKPTKLILRSSLDRADWKTS